MSLQQIIKVEDKNVLVKVWNRDTWSNLPQKDMDVLEIDGKKALDYFLSNKNEYFDICKKARPIAYGLI